MTIKRQSTIPSTFSMGELLAYLQVEGRLRDIAVPDWATGTSVEELLDALRLIGDGEWLLDMPGYRGRSPQGAADQWLRNFMDGHPVCHPDDRNPDSSAESTPAAASPAMDEDEAQYVESSLLEYVATLSPTARTRFEKRLEQSPALKVAALEQISIMSRLLVVCALADEEVFLAERDSWSQLGGAMDKDLRAMSLHYLAAENRAALFQELEESGADIRRAEKRAKEIHVDFKKMGVSRPGK